jgi:SpoVK/Ycf46/Vps4 family AAA+-type ATPase
LVLPRERLDQLREALARVRHQARVIDDWGFLDDRPGARGVRMLFAGPPGTGKTLSAEVLAHSLATDLLVVDLARLVSKWIGETEKNLAEVFEAAERSRAVLLFDEADALFGKRTEVSDAHDRYANLETAYLLARLERFEGLAILSTNLRQNLDSAFTRRLEFILDFDPPGRAERLALWRCHLPAEAPLAGDVDLDELAAGFPLVGGLIRNAAVAAAFLAAAEDRSITLLHLVHSIRSE